jgi:hypothetical protein
MDRELQVRFDAIDAALAAVLERLNTISNPAAEPGPGMGRLKPYTPAEFAALIGRPYHWVTDRCRAGLIATVPRKRKPYRIPPGEYVRMMREATKRNW